MRKSIYRVFGFAALLWSVFALVGTKETLAECRSASTSAHRL